VLPAYKEGVQFGVSWFVPLSTYPARLVEIERHRDSSRYLRLMPRVSGPIGANLHQVAPAVAPALDERADTAQWMIVGLKILPGF
jgi:hypothetical protein